MLTKNHLKVDQIRAVTSGWKKDLVNTFLRTFLASFAIRKLQFKHGMLKEMFSKPHPQQNMSPCTYCRREFMSSWLDIQTSTEREEFMSKFHPTTHNAAPRPEFKDI